MLIINKIFIINKIDGIKDNDELVKKFIELKIRKLSKLEK